MRVLGRIRMIAVQDGAGFGFHGSSLERHSSKVGLNANASLDLGAVEGIDVRLAFSRGDGDTG